MSTGLIIAIVVVALILLAVLFLIPRMRRKAEMRKRERELANRRDAVATEHREVADSRQREADEAERRARMAQKEAERQRAEAELHQERAAMHERGDADHELIEEHERDKFAGTSADPDGTMAEQPRSEFDRGREVGHDEEREGRFMRDGRTEDAPSEAGTTRRS
jgi:flagellar biosynthesis/type III secretory pathway M-ring protein FliF/YscJ